MATSRPFQAEMETDVRQDGNETMVSDVYTRLRVIRFGFPAGLFSFFQIFKVAHYPGFRKVEALRVAMLGLTFQLRQ
jgi:hypothetical protein